MFGWWLLCLRAPRLQHCIVLPEIVRILLLTQGLGEGTTPRADVPFFGSVGLTDTRTTVARVARGGGVSKPAFSGPAGLA